MKFKVNFSDVKLGYIRLFLKKYSRFIRSFSIISSNKKRRGKAKKKVVACRDNNIGLVFASLFLLLLSSLSPNLFADYIGPNGGEILLSENSILPIDVVTSDNAIAFSDDGFVMKVSPQTVQGDRSQMSEIIRYKVEEGDNLSKIASKFSIDVNTIIWANNISNLNRLRVGQELKILPVPGVLHSVEKGENLSKIAKKYKVSIASVTQQNSLKEESNLQAGEKIIIPGGKKIYIKSYSEPKKLVASAGSVGKGSKKSKSVGGAIINSKPLVAESRKLIRPSSGTTTQGYRAGHRAIDIASRMGTPIKAAQSGVVIKAMTGWNGGYGNVIVVDHGNGMQTLYAHIKPGGIYVKKGQNVSKGQVIGAMGNTGLVYGATGIHLHFEVRLGNRKVNPNKYL